MPVSVFIPIHNASACIDATLQSVLGQSYQDLEVWLVDDCSTDDTVEKLKQWQKNDSRVHILTKERNEGFVPFSWNLVFSHLKGEFVLYMSHDDQLSPDCIKLLVAEQQRSNADAVIPDCVFVRDDGSQTTSFSNSMHLGRKHAFAKMLNYDIPGFALWRTSLLVSTSEYQLSIINYQLPRIMPTDAWNSDEGMQRIWALNCKKGVALCPKAKFYYHLSAGSITKGLKPYHITGLKTQKRLFLSAIKSGTFLSHPICFLRFSWQYAKSYRYLTKSLPHESV